MMGRFCRYIDKVFQFVEQLQTLSDTRQRPVIPTNAVIASAFTMFATARLSLNRLEIEIHVPARLRGIVGPRLLSVDSIGRVYCLLDRQPLDQMLSAINHRVRRNKALGETGRLQIAAVDGHEFFASRKRCCPHCQTRIVPVAGQGRNVALVLGDHTLEESTWHAGDVSSWTRSLGRRKRLLQNAFHALGTRPLLQTRAACNRELRAHLLHRLRALAVLLAGQSQGATAHHHQHLDRPGR